MPVLPEDARRAIESLPPGSPEYTAKTDLRVFCVIKSKSVGIDAVVAIVPYCDVLAMAELALLQPKEERERDGPWLIVPFTWKSSPTPANAPAPPAEAPAGGKP